MINGNLDPTDSQLELIRRRQFWILVNCREVAPNSGQFSWYIYQGTWRLQTKLR